MIGRAVILKPVVNEKSMNLIKLNMYTFEVDSDANKDQIKKAVEGKFNVTVKAVKTLNKKGKVKMQRTRRAHYTTTTIKRALVEVKKGDRIAIFEAPKEESVEVTTADNIEPKKEVNVNSKVKSKNMQEDKKEIAAKKQIAKASKKKGEVK